MHPLLLLINFSRKLIQLPKKSIEAWPHGQRLLRSALLVGRMVRMATFKMRAFIWQTKRLFLLSPTAESWVLLLFGKCCKMHCSRRWGLHNFLSSALDDDILALLRLESHPSQIFRPREFFTIFFSPILFWYVCFLLTICCWFLLNDGEWSRRGGERNARMCESRTEALTYQHVRVHFHSHHHCHRQCQCHRHRHRHVTGALNARPAAKEAKVSTLLTRFHGLLLPCFGR